MPTCNLKVLPFSGAEGRAGSEKTLTPNTICSIPRLYRRRSEVLPSRCWTSVGTDLCTAETLDSRDAGFAHEAIGPELVGLTGLGGGIPVLHPPIHFEYVPACRVEAEMNILAVLE